MELNYFGARNSYSGEYQIFDKGQAPILNGIHAFFYIFYIVIKYKSIKNYLKITLKNAKIYAINDSKTQLNKGILFADYENLKLDFSISNSLFKHYYLLSSTAKRNTFKEHEDWIIQTCFNDIKKVSDDRLKYLFICHFKNNLKDTLKLIHLIGTYEKADIMTFEKCFKDEDDIVKLMFLLKKYNVLDSKGQFKAKIGYLSILICKLSKLGIILPLESNLELLHEKFQERFKTFAIKTLYDVRKEFYDKESVPRPLLQQKFDSFYYLDELNRLN